MYLVMALPPFEVGALHEIVADALLAMATTLVGAPAVVMGVTGAEANDGAPEPTAFAAATVKVYAVPFVSPMMVQFEPVVVHEAPPGAAVTVNPMMALPPLFGRLKETRTEVLPAMPRTPVGASGVVTGVMAGDAVDDALEPTALIATTVKV